MYFDPIEDCITPKPKSDKLLDKGRVQFSMKVVCAKLDQLPQARTQENALEFITVSIGNEQVTFDDVKTREWFATSVSTAIRTGIMSGYKGTDGKLTGKFGPSDTVTLAQLAKVAHRLAGIDETKDRTLAENERARGTWFADVYASAERNHWLAYQSIRENPERSATRSEVVCTLLQALDIPRLWAKGKLFSDVTTFTPYADCIETAAADKLITGDDAGTFRPESPINRAELSKILTTAMSIYGEKTAEIRGNYDGVKERK
ncbi:MAG: S-layer domain-containing protein [Candidatus Peregrinibacteria bacterium Greene0416_62]|nr:MAG: S-layer domain-containing protein [Candidatus Peregrinibacteria bacterium Greene0416_62]